MSGLRLQRVTTAVPWPRGIVSHDGGVMVLARGRPRGAGGPDPNIDDRGGTLFSVDPNVWEWVDQALCQAGSPVTANATPFADPTEPPFKLWDSSTNPPSDDIDADRPYTTIDFDHVSRNYFVTGFSGIDAAANQWRFRKNAADTVHRFDSRDSRWHRVEAHNAEVVPIALRSSMTPNMPNNYFPHHDVTGFDPPHGWLNGPDGLRIVGDFLYVVGKDNHSLIQYALSGIRANPGLEAATSRAVLIEVREVPRLGGGVPIPIDSYSALETDGEYLYLGARYTTNVVRFPLDSSGDVRKPIAAQLIAQFEAGSNLLDLAFSTQRELYASTATKGEVWNIGVPNPNAVFYAVQHKPAITLRSTTCNPKAKCTNITFDDQNRLYICCNNNDDPGGSPRVAGVVYRAVEGDEESDSSLTGPDPL